MALRSLDNLFVIPSVAKELKQGAKSIPAQPGPISQIKAINSKYISPSDKMGFFILTRLYLT
jgi:hypothetical protein